MFGQVSFLAETFSTEMAREGLLPGVGPDMDIDAVFIFEAFVADVAIVEQP